MSSSNITKLLVSGEMRSGTTFLANFLNSQAGNVTATHAAATVLENYVGFWPQASVKECVKRFVECYQQTANKELDVRK